MDRSYHFLSPYSLYGLACPKRMCRYDAAHLNVSGRPREIASSRGFISIKSAHLRLGFVRSAICFGKSVECVRLVYIEGKKRFVNLA